LPGSGPFVDDENRALHDVLAGTVVAQVDPQPVREADRHGCMTGARRLS
jgi:uncharacterized RDD family membrane protein YckC